MRTSIRLGVALACLLGAAWTCSALMRPRRVASMTFEQCLELVRQGTVCEDQSGQSDDGGFTIEQ